jgi:hypothetical protein
MTLDIARLTRRSWTVIALVLVGLALIQACGKSGSSTGPSANSALQLKLRRAGGALLPCSGGTYVITAPGYPPLTGSFGQDGQINVQLTVGVTYTITVNACGLTGSTVITVPPGGATGEIVIVVSKVLGLSCSPSTVAPGETSTCTCNVQSPGPANITWTSVNATGSTAKFSNDNPGVYPITCTVNGVDTRSTTVTVEQPPAPPAVTTGTIRVTNTASGQLLRPRGVVLKQIFGEFFVRVRRVPSGPVSGVRTVLPGQKVQFTGLASGDYQVEYSCNSSFDGFDTDGPRFLPPGGTLSFSRNGNLLCGG